MNKNQDIYEVTFADLEKITGFTYRTIRRKLTEANPVREDHRSSYYNLKEVLPLIFGDNKNEKEKVTIEEIKARTRNWNVTADRSEIKKALEEGSVVPLDEAMKVISDMMLAFKVKLEALPTRIATIDGEDYFFRVEQAEAIVDEALKELNDDALRKCSQGNMEPGNDSDKTDPKT